MKPSTILFPALLTAFAPLAAADLKFTSPAAGATLQPGSIKVQWNDDGSQKFTAFTLSLCAGGNADGSYIPLTDFTTTGSPSVDQIEGVVAAGIGASTPKNAYFFRMQLVVQGGMVTYFTPRFTIGQMTGSFPQNVITGAQGVTGTDGPAPIKNVAQPGAGAGGAAQFSVDFNKQTGLTRYAPMQAIPPTKITKKNPTPLHPKSDFVIAKSPLPIPSIIITVTESQTFSVKSRENPATPAPMPKDSMQKYLNRWKD